MQHPNPLTIAVLVAAAALLGAFDVFQLVKKGYQATISYTLLTVARLYPIIHFATGVLMGHLFWQNCPHS